MTDHPPIAIVHLDESCLGNGRDGATPGGAGGLIEIRARSGLERRDFFLHAEDTTNNRMALTGATTVLRLLGTKGRTLRVLLVSDSEYFVRGMREWVPGWRARGWRRSGGAIENLALWQDLVEAATQHDIQYAWVRGHAGHPKNEYANDLAVGAARTQRSSDGVVASGFGEWLSQARGKGRYAEYDPDAAFESLERRLARAESLPLALVE